MGFIKLPESFKLILFIFTLLIIAHDWLSYNQNKKTENFWLTIPQILSLFFLSQMFLSIESNGLQNWYAFAFFYSLTNIVIYLMNNGKYALFKKINGFYLIKYLIHLVLCISFFFTNNSYSPRFYIVLAPTVVMIFALWIYESKLLSKSKQETPAAPTKSAENIQFYKLQKAISNINKKLINNDKKLISNDKKLDDIKK